MKKTSVKSYSSMTTHNINDGRLVLDRVDSSVTKVCDLHVYKLPTELWRHNLNNVLNNVVTETVSVGIIRVPSELRLVDIREEIVQQLSVHSDHLVPKEYVFLRSVGRSLTTLREQQEHQLKAKHFVPPVAYAPELYILEATPEVIEALAISETSSRSPVLSQTASPSHRGYPNTYPHGYHGGVSRHDDLPKDDYIRRHRDQYETTRRGTRDDSLDRSAASSEDGSEDETRGHQHWQEDQDDHGLSTEHVTSDEEDMTRDKRSTQQERKHEKTQLQKSIGETRQTRQEQERERNDMLKKAKQIQQKTAKRRSEARDMWKKKYFEEKKKMSPLEDNSNSLENELEALHRKQMNMLEGNKEKNVKLLNGGPSEKNNYILQCARLQYETEDLQRRVEHARMKLTAEMKLRVQAQSEMKVVRNEAMQNRSSLRNARAHHGSLAMLSSVK